jgi:DNA-binding SARP family transcriptional activator/TolB-like protein
VKGLSRGPSLDVTVLGTPSFAVAGIPVQFRSRKAEGLLARLCLAPDGRLSREAAANLFWEDSSEHHARSSLRQTLLILRRNLEPLGFDGLSSDKQVIAIDLSRVRLDLDDLLATNGPLPLRLLHERRLSERLFEGGELLSEPFTAWLRERRQQLHDELRAMLEPMLGHPRANFERIEEAAIALLNLDPTHEPACRAFIRARASRGDYASALRAYEDLWNVLDEEFDTQPSSETQELIVDIKLGRFPEQQDTPQGGESSAAHGGLEEHLSEFSGPVPEGGTSALSEIGPKVAVVVAPIIREGQEADWLTEVFRQDLISRLVRFREWAVLEDMTEELERSGVPLYRIAVSAMRDGDRLIYTVTAKNHRSGHYVWGSNRSVPAGQGLAALAEVVSEFALVAQARVHMEQAAAMTAQDAPLHAHDRLVRARQLMQTRRISDSLRAEEMLSGLIQDFPRFGAAYASLAHVLNNRPLVFPGTRHTPRSLERATALAGTAIGLDPLDSRALVTFAWSAARQNRDDLAQQTYRRALDLNPCDPWTVLCATYGLAGYGAFEEVAQITHRMDETGVVSGSALRCLQAGTLVLGENHEKALACLKRVGTDLICGELWRTLALVGLGRQEEARIKAARLQKSVVEKWVLPRAPSPGDIGRWLVSCVPAGAPEVRARLARWLVAAGIVLPDDLALDFEAIR